VIEYGFKRRFILKNLTRQKWSLKDMEVHVIIFNFYYFYMSKIQQNTSLSLCFLKKIQIRDYSIKSVFINIIYKIVFFALYSIYSIL